MRAPALLLLTAFVSLATAVHGQDSVFDRRVSGPFDSVVVDNPFGPTDIQSWAERDVRVLATRTGSATGSPLSSDLDVVRSDNRSLRIAVRNDASVRLQVFVPMNTRVSMASDRGGSDRDALTRSDYSAPDASAAFGATRPRSVMRARAAMEAPDEGSLELNAMLVNLDVRVADGAGRNLTTLTAKDFEVFEDGKRQQVVEFRPITEPVNLVLLLDLSGSTKDKMDEIRMAAIEFIDSLNPSNNVAVAAFTRKFLLVSSFTTDRALLRQRVADLQNRDSGTAYYDSLWTALELFDEVEGGRRVVVVLTDGVDNTLSDPGDYQSRHSFDEVLGLASRRETMVFPIYFDTEYEVVVQRGLGSHEAYKTARHQLDQLARDTGGIVFRSDRPGDMENAYRRVAAELQSIYSLAYESSNPKRDGSWRAIDVKVRRTDATVRARRGYHAR